MGSKHEDPDETGQSHFHQVPEGIHGVRLSNYAAGIFPGLPAKSGLKKAIRKGEVFVRDRLASTGTLVREGDVIEWRRPDYIPPKIFQRELEVVFEDEYLAVVNKPAGITVSGNRSDTVENALAGQLVPSSCGDALPRARAVHRLDSQTSGLLLVAKTMGARIELGRMLEKREIAKTYLALVIGEAPEEGMLEDTIDGKEAVTRFERISLVSSLVSGKLSLLNLHPETGRTHQIRIHLSQAGFPILGDKLYGDPGFLLKRKGLFLSAVKLEFLHPVNGMPLSFSIPAPVKFVRFMEGEKKRWEKYGSSSAG